MSLAINNELALLTIVAALSYFQECPYDISWTDQEKEEATFSRWMLNEMLDIVWDNPWQLASDTIKNLILKLQLYVKTSKTQDQIRIFSIAAETASEILEKITEVEK